MTAYARSVYTCGISRKRKKRRRLRRLLVRSRVPPKLQNYYPSRKRANECRQLVSRNWKRKREEGGQRKKRNEKETTSVDGWRATVFEEISRELCDFPFLIAALRPTRKRREEHEQGLVHPSLSLHLIETSPFSPLNWKDPRRSSIVCGHESRETREPSISTLEGGWYSRLMVRWIVVRERNRS